jgi:hypothetical protein
LVATSWPVTSQSNSMRMAARCCFTDGFSEPALHRLDLRASVTESIMWDPVARYKTP